MLLIWLSVCALICKASDGLQFSDSKLTQQWIVASNSFDRLVWPQKDYFASLINDTLHDEALNLTKSCRNSLKTVVSGLQRRDHWAYKLMDATGKGRSGLAYGYLSDLGNMDECLSIDEANVQGQYCLLRISFPLPDRSKVNMQSGIQFNLKGTPLEGTVYKQFADHLELMMFTDTSFYFGLCVPSDCDPETIQRVVTKQLTNSELTGHVTPFCETTKSEMPFYQKGSICIVALYATVVIYANLFAELLFAETTDPVTKRISYVHGVRGLYQILALLAHMWDIQPLLPFVYPTFYHRDYNWLFEQFGRCIGYSIQVIFFMSGAVSTIVTFPDVVKKKGNISLASFTAKRWLRITNILYVSNWMRFEQQCMLHTWTQSADFQLYVLSFFVLMTLYRSPKKGVYLCLFLIGLSMITSTLATYLYDLPPHPNFDGTDAREYDVAGPIYAHTYLNMGSYFLGVLLAFLFLNNKELPKKYHSLGWVITISMHLLTLYVPWYWSQTGVKPSRVVELAYSGLYRMTFVAFYAYVGYMCAFNTGGIWNKFLELKFWVPLSRMSLSVFLSHFTIVWYDIPNNMEYMPTRFYPMLTKLVYMLVICWTYGYVVYLLFEAPFMSFGKQLLRKQQPDEAAKKRSADKQDAHNKSINCGLFGDFANRIKKGA